MAIKNDFTMYGGVSKVLEVYVKDSNNSVIDLTGASIKWVVKKNIKATDYILEKTNSSGITLTNPSQGIFNILLKPLDTKLLFGPYYHVAELTDLSENVSIILFGQINIQKSGL